MARPRRQEEAVSESQETFECPECGKTFDRAASLGAHRQRVHGVAGRSKRQTQSSERSSTRQVSGSRRRRTSEMGAAASDGRSRVSVDRSALLKQVFPGGIPPRDEVVRRVNAWLDEAEELATLK